ncbi:class E sortase [Kitasatospora sp. NA04385]|uniref:class E sortase n=1 Tax=Kitasatospora sp. NA04385 TaxID=2742135 RepID=UPI00159193B3|nr:class E sortase [Kitasatospora sp. NA04385]QKW20788.1 class E sortase [Kitasatospora sp. NA04385]
MGTAIRGGRRRGRPAAVLGLLGEVLITLGLVLALFVGYSLWWTDVVADRSAGRMGDRLRQTWTAPAAPPEGSGTAPVPQYAAGDGVGFLHVPAFGPGDQTLIRMGTTAEVLNEGVAGVYEEPYRSAMPWDAEGNFALAAHRDGHGAKFHDLDRLAVGDPVVVETKDAWYVYKVAGTLPQTSKYDVGVVAPVPEGSPFTGPGRYLTLTTCTPVYTSRYRMAVWAELVRVDPVDARRTPPSELR